MRELMVLMNEGVEIKEKLSKEGKHWLWLEEKMKCKRV